MKYIEINEDLCAGCALCSEMSPELFSMENHTAKAKKGRIRNKQLSEARKATEHCPSEAIKIKETCCLSIYNGTGQS